MLNNYSMTHKNYISIENRINWIDWAKTIAILFVIFGHIPQEKGSFPINYIVTFHMPLFFFISGYLTKKEVLNNKTCKKYWHTLIFPYFLYNLLFYPYWVIRHAIEFPDANWFDYLKPIIGTIMMQCETTYFEPLNGVTWFIIALLLFKVIFSACNHFVNGNKIIISIVITTLLLHILNENKHFFVNLTPVGILKCFPFFYLGYICKIKKIFSTRSRKKNLLFCLSGISISLLAYYGDTYSGNYIYYGFRFWIICISAISGFIYGCKMLDSHHYIYIENISTGTIVIMAFHFILIGTTNYIIEKAISIQEITYPWYVSLSLSITYVALLYPIISLLKKYPLLLGKIKNN